MKFNKILAFLFLSSIAFAGNTNRDIPGAQVTFKQITTPSAPASGYDRCYVKSDDKLYCENSSSVETLVGGFSFTPNNHGILASTSVSTTANVIAPGTSGWVLTSNGASSDATFQAAAVSTTLTTKGDLQTFSTVNARQPVAPDYGMVLADSAQTTGLRSATYLTKEQGLGTKNYIQYSDFENGATTGWTLGTIGTLTNALPTGTPTFGSGASGNLSIAAATSSPLSGVDSLSYISSAATTLGNMVASSAITIDASDQAKVLTVKFNYNVFSGAANANFSGTSSNSYAWAVWDVTNSAWLSSAGNFCMNQNAGTGYCTGTVQTGITTASIRFVVYNSVATTGAATIYLDDFYVGPTAAPRGPPVTDWVAYTPTFTSYGTVTISQFYSRRVGDTLEVKGHFIAGTFTATPNQITIGYAGANSNVTVDTTKVNVGNVIGKAGATANATTVIFGWSVLAPTSNASYVQIGTQTSGSSDITVGVNGNGLSIANGADIEVFFSVPIVGWSSNTAMSQDADTRVVSYIGALSSGSQTTSGSPQTITTWTTTKDTHGAFNAATGTYTVQVTGYYEVDASVNITANATGVRYLQVVQAGSTSVTVSGSTIGGFVGTGNATSISTGFYCVAGDTLIVQSFQNSGGSLAYNTGNLFIHKLSGPATIAAMESVNARYTFVGNSNLPNATNETLSSTYATYTKIKDTHNSFNSSTGVYTIPVSGSYLVSLRAYVNPTSASSGTMSVSVVQAGSASTASNAYSAFGSVSGFTSASITDVFNCLTGDTITLQAIQNNSSNNLPIGAVSGGNAFSISRVGN